jgi:hypothetical protein
MFEKKLQELVNEFTNNLIKLVLSRVTSAIVEPFPLRENGVGYVHIPTPPPPTKTLKKPIKPKSVKFKKSDDEMRCRFADKQGHRCKERSQGPRFHFLCKKHQEKK